ncbi:MAG: hypothetical protein Q8Q48_03555 [Candidatus Staskawiczbacteria bacterium]|nr:hypothetical protein [Candidatus Staskawiczbacteria bacterium]
MKLQEKFISVKLRKSGKSYNDILKVINVSKSTLSLWLRDIELTPKQREELLVGRKKSQYASAQAKRQRRIELTEEIINESKKEVGGLIKNPLFLSGLMLYWAEGDKAEMWEMVKFSNSDPQMIRLIMRWFRVICKVPEEKFRIGVHMHKLHCRKDIEKYWSEVTGVPLSQFYKTQIKPTSLIQRKNKLYDGTCAVVVGNKNLFRKIRGWKLGFVDKINII